MHVTFVDSTKLEFSRHVLLSAAHYKISRNCILPEPKLFHSDGQMDGQDGNNSCYRQFAKVSTTRLVTKCAGLFLKQMILIIV